MALTAVAELQALIAAKISHDRQLPDIEQVPVAEAAGLETLRAGMRASIADDDALLDAASAAFDYFSTALNEPP